MKPHAEFYSTHFLFHGNYESVIIERNLEAKPQQLKVTLFLERWRSPEETVELYRKVADFIEKEFVKK